MYRDEIYCQLCAQVTKNPTPENCAKGWQLHALCAGCFLPSREVESRLLGLGLDLGLEAKFSGLGLGLGLGLDAFGLGLVFLALALFKAKVKVTNILPNTVYLGIITL